MSSDITSFAPRNRRLLAISVAMALLGSALLADTVTADLVAHPADIHTGSCAEAGEVVAPLNDVTGEVTGAPAMGSDAAIHVEASVTAEVLLAYASLFASPHSIVVHRGPSDEDVVDSILCGDIGGHEMVSTDFAIGLEGLDDSGYTGIATIHDNGDATVDVAVYMTSAVAWTGAASGSDERSLPPASPAAASAAPELSPGTMPVGLFPLPETVLAVPPDIPTVSVEPASEPGLVVGTPYPFTLQHCGLLSPFDADGSLWQPVTGRDSEGGPIDSDDEIGEFINATPGELTLISPDQVEFVTLTGHLIALQRAPDALDYPLCM